MVEAAEEISGKEIDVNLEKIEEYERDVLANVGLRASKVKDEVWKFASGVSDPGTTQKGPWHRRRVVVPLVVLLSATMTWTASSTRPSLRMTAPANKEFPFPYLSPKDFRFAVSDLVKIMRPGGGADDKFARASCGCRVQKVAKRSGHQRRWGDPVGRSITSRRRSYRISLRSRHRDDCHIQSFNLRTSIFRSRHRQNGQSPSQSRRAAARLVA